MDYRVMIKSVLAANDRGVYEETVQEIEGEQVPVRVKVAEAPRIREGDTFSVDLRNRILTVNCSGGPCELPISDHDYALKDLP